MAEAESEVAERVLRWQELQGRGPAPDLKVLCADRPDLAAEVERRVRLLQAAAAVMGVGAEGATLAPNDGALTLPHRDGASAPPEVPGYELLGELGRGGMGVVYKARQVAANRPVALKMILAGGHASDADRQRFRTEAESVARLNHPHIVQIFEVGEADGNPYFSLEYCDGGSLSQQLAGTPLAPDRAAALVQTLARAMQAAHQVGIIHRDLKPANVLFAADGTPKVTDFGLAKKAGAADGPTVSGSIMGTPSYMAPEQAGGKTSELGPAVDVYALGAILYECLTGRPPFKGATVLDTLDQVRHRDPVPPRQLSPGVPRDLETIALKCLQKDPARRYASADALADDLRRFCNGETIHARPVGAAEKAVKWARRRPAIASLLAAVALVGMIGLTGILWQWDRERRARRSTRQTLYAAHMNLANRAWIEGDLARALELLRQHLPEAGEEDLRGWEWYHLWQNAHADELTLGHDRWVRSVAWSPDGKYLAAGSYDNTVRVWDADSGVALHTFQGHTDAVHRVAFHKDKDRPLIASCGDDGTVRLWDLKSASKDGEVIFTYCAKVWALAFSPDGKTLATADRKGEATLHAVNPSGASVALEDVGPCNCLTFSPDGERIAFGCDEGELILHDTVRGRSTRHCFADTLGEGVNILSLAFSPDGRTLALGDNSGAVRLWDLSKPEPEAQTRRPHTGSVWGLDFSPDGSLLASASWDGTVVLWPIKPASRDLVTLRGHLAAVKYAAFHPLDSRRLATASQDGTVRLWSLPVRQGVRLVPFPGASDVLAPALGDALLVRGTNSVHCRSASGEDLPLPEGLAARLTAAPVALSGDGKVIAVAAGRDIHLLDRSTGKEIASRPDCHDDAIDLVSLSADGQAVLTGCGKEEQVRVWAVAGGSLDRAGGHTGLETGSALFSRDGKWVALLAREGGEVRLWDRRSRRSRPLKGQEGRIEALAFAPDGKSLAGGGRRWRGDVEYGLVYVWDVSTGRAGVPIYATKRVRSLAYSPDGKTLAVGDDEGTIKLWAPARGEEKATLRFAGGEASVRRLCFAGDGRSLAAFVKARSGEGSTLTFYPACTDREIRAYLERTRAANPGDETLARDLRRLSGK